MNHTIKSLKISTDFYYLCQALTLASLLKTSVETIHKSELCADSNMFYA